MKDYLNEIRKTNKNIAIKEVFIFDFNIYRRAYFRCNFQGA